MLATAAQAASAMTDCSPNVVNRKMPSAGARIMEALVSRLSSMLMRMRCRCGTRSGMSALKAGSRNAWRTLSSVAITSTRGNDRKPAWMTSAMTMATTARNALQAMTIALRLKRSAASPPKGDKSPCGRNEHTETAATASALEVLSVTNQSAA